MLMLVAMFFMNRDLEGGMVKNMFYLEKHIAFRGKSFGWGVVDLFLMGMDLFTECQVIDVERQRRGRCLVWPYEIKEYKE